MTGHSSAAASSRKSTSRGRLRLPAVVPESVPGVLRTPVPARSGVLRTPLPARLPPLAGGSRNSGRPQNSGVSFRRPNSADATPRLKKRGIGKAFKGFYDRNKKLLRTALDNAVTIDVDLRELAAVASELNDGGVADLLDGPLAHLKPQSFTDGQPRSFFDRNGLLIAFHFPGYLSPSVSRAHATYLDEFADKFPPQMSADTQGRGAKQGYRGEGDNKVGCHHISPGWKEIGKPNEPLRFSGSLAGTKPHAAATQHLLSQIQIFQMRIEHLIEIATPDAHRAYSKAMDHLRQGTETAVHANGWSSSFQGISIIYNRETPSHRDAKGCLAGVDALLTVGPYHGCTLDLPIFRTSLGYESGTLLLLVGCIVPHKVTPWSAGGQRLCLVHFTHKDILDEYAVPHPQFTTFEGLRAAYPSLPSE